LNKYNLTFVDRGYIGGYRTWFPGWGADIWVEEFDKNNATGKN
jgi:hypothetical protein